MTLQVPFPPVPDPRSVELQMALDKIQIGRRLYELREQQNLTQRQVAEAIPYDVRGYQRWERGKIRPSAKNIERLAKVLGVTESEIDGSTTPLDPLGPADVKRLEKKLDQVLRRLETNEQVARQSLQLLAEGLPDPPPELQELLGLNGQPTDATHTQAE